MLYLVICVYTTMALGSTEPLVKMITRNIPGCKGGRCVRLTTPPPSCAERHEIWEPKPPGTLWVTPGLLRDSFTFIYVYTAGALSLGIPRVLFGATKKFDCLLVLFGTLLHLCSEMNGKCWYFIFNVTCIIL